MQGFGGLSVGLMTVSLVIALWTSHAAVNSAADVRDGGLGILSLGQSMGDGEAVTQFQTEFADSIIGLDEHHGEAVAFAETGASSASADAVGGVTAATLAFRSIAAAYPADEAGAVGQPAYTDASCTQSDVIIVVSFALSVGLFASVGRNVLRSVARSHLVSQFTY